MVIMGAGVNHWYHQDMTYRSIINFLMMCGTVGGLRRRLGPLCGPGETPAASRLDHAQASRSTGRGQHARWAAPLSSTLTAISGVTRKWMCKNFLSPLADPALYRGSMIDLNVRAERMGWLPRRRSLPSIH